MSSKKHTHKYKLVNIGKIDKPIKVYACSLPDCSHHMPPGSNSLVIGKESLCHQCLKKMIMTPAIVSRLVVRPRCYECKGGIKPSDKVKKVDKPLDNAIDMLLKMRMG